MESDRTRGLFGVIAVPRLPLQAVVRARGRAAGRRPLAVLDGWAGVALAESVSSGRRRARGGDRGMARVVAVDAAASRAGVVAGMTATQAQARCAGLEVVGRDRDEERRMRDRLLEVAAGFSPDFEESGEGMCTIDLIGSRLAPRAFGREARDRMAGEGIACVVGVAADPDLAALAARLAERGDARRADGGGGAEEEGIVVVVGGRAEAAAFLAPLPVRALGLSGELLGVLDSWGVRTLGELAALPAAEVGERLGPEGAALWRRATGGRERRLLRLVRVPEVFACEIELEHRIESLEPLLFLVRRLLESLVARLRAGGWVAADVEVGLAFEDGLRHGRRLRVPEPSADVDLLFRLVQTHLEGVTAPAPVVALRLEVERAAPPGRQFQLFEAGLRDPNRFADTLGRLEAFLGTERVGTPEVLDTFRPDAFRLRPFTEECPEASDDGPAARVPGAGGAGDGELRLGPPLRRYRPPEPAEIGTAPGSRVPDSIRSRVASGRIVRLHGPWRHSGEWWERSRRWSREEWDVELRDGRLFRLVRTREGWFLEGSYR